MATGEDRGRRATARPGQLCIIVRWGDTTLAHRLLVPGERLSVGPDGDVVVPLDSTLVYELDHDGVACLVRNERVVLTDRHRIASGSISIEAELVPWVELPRGRAPRSWRMAACTALAALMAAGTLGVSACWIPSAQEREEEAAEQHLLMRHYLLAAAEREEETRSIEAAADGREGGTGTRARGDDGSMGNPHQPLTGSRYGVGGPRDPSIAHAAALRDAAEFGMIGLLSSSAAGAPPQGVPTTGTGGIGTSGEPAEGARRDAPSTSPELEPRTDRFVDYGVNAPIDPTRDPMSTFAIDVDTGTFPLLRRTHQAGNRLSPEAVRPEEIINYFDYGYPGPEQEALVVHLHSAPSPFERGHEILRVGVQARRVERSQRKPAHLVYLVDVSGSMDAADKLGLAKESLRLLTDNLRPGDTVALCTYAGNVREVLPPTPIAERQRILDAIDDLTSEGSTAMSDGITLAYDLAERTLVPGHVNRVVVLSDGDANVGAVSHEEILGLIDRQRRRGITLSTIGFGTGNYNDAMMEQLADEGDGNYRYVDSPREAQKVFVDEIDGMLEVVAKDVKVQIAFDPRVVQSYRLIGYENRDVADADFRDDTVDGGEVGAGHHATALYDVVLRPVRLAAAGHPWVTAHVRHKAPDADHATEQAFPLPADHSYATFAEADPSFRFATAAAGLAEVLRESPYATRWSLDDIARIAAASSEGDPHRQELAVIARESKS